MRRREINRVMHHQMLAGIAYEKIAGVSWEMRRMEQDAEKELSAYVSQLYAVQHLDKTPYDQVIFDSEVERQFAADLDKNSNVRYFLKLPHGDDHRNVGSVDSCLFSWRAPRAPQA